MAQSRKVNERREAARLISSNIVVLPDKKQAWDDLFQLSKDWDSALQWSAVKVLGLVFSQMSYKDKEQAWADLHKLIQDNDPWVRQCAICALISVFPYLPDKKQAWDDLIRLTSDTAYVQELAAKGLGDVFPQVPHKEQAWCDLQRLLHSKDAHLKCFVVGAIGDNFIHIPNKNQAWMELVQLIKSNSYYQAVFQRDRSTSYVRERALFALIKAFPGLPDKKQAWNDLQQLTHDKDSIMLRRIAYILGCVFPYLPDKKQAWSDLQKLTKDGNDLVQAFANYSLGRASVFKATEAQTEDDYKNELENALEFFNKSLMELPYSNPARFCLPFYRAFYAIVFKKDKAKTDAYIYLVEAKLAIEGSKSREKLLEAVENLANALKEVQKVQEIGLDAMKSNLNTYRKYCEQVADLLVTTEERAPRATKLIKMGLPIIDKKIKAILWEIEEKARQFCKESKGTSLEKISRNIHEYAKGLEETENPIIVMIRLDKLTPLLHRMCEILPEGSRRVVCNQLENIKEAELPNKTNVILTTLTCIMVQGENMQKRLEYLEERVLLKLDNISHGVSKLKLRSGEVVQSLHEIQDVLYELITIQADFNKGLSLNNSKIQELLTRINNGITRLAGEIKEDIIPILPPNNDTTKEILENLEKLQDLKLCKEEVLFNRGAGLASIISLILYFKSIL